MQALHPVHIDPYPYPYPYPYPLPFPSPARHQSSTITFTHASAEHGSTGQPRPPSHCLAARRCSISVCICVRDGHCCSDKPALYCRFSSQPAGTATRDFVNRPSVLVCQCRHAWPPWRLSSRPRRPTATAPGQHGPAKVPHYGSVAVVYRELPLSLEANRRRSPLRRGAYLSILLFGPARTPFRNPSR
ncbi:hypothetical protein K505DRAFT_85935 [Melanomma pulvis-pyrius CBS 109.77]|uniref:Uncharacterized protein n=1 Tax=Melanomma pulvis-pyrius CBS 109.77 TaxID=1314802 RepID=A0A6A6X0Y5_9PLEO|nr:hypothetical protein K505DRAFT_85935 [Melanomma pulvis-pyrius CBS 109.77]